LDQQDLKLSRNLLPLIKRDWKKKFLTEV